jgi:outer membrane biosynthesis protein TonB
MHKAQGTMTSDRPRRWVRAALCALCLVHLGLFAGACAKAQAKAAPEGPPLNVPMPPPRVLAPVDEPLAENPPEPEPAAPPPPRTAASPARPTQARPRTTTTTTEPEPKPETPVQAPPPAAEAPAPPTRPAPTQDAAAERRIRTVMQKAATDLNNVDYRKLSADARAQYELSKRFNEQADQALKDRDYKYATTLADKASALATELLGR